jgi:CRP-like cAMP-binding protein
MDEADVDGAELPNTPRGAGQPLLERSAGAPVSANSPTSSASHGLGPGVGIDGVGPAERARLLERYGRVFVGGATIFQEGAPAREAFLLQEGRVRLFKRVGVSDRSLALLKPGDLFGEGALLEGLVYGSTAVALTDGSGLALDRATFRSLLANHPQVSSRVVDQLVRRLRDAEDQIEIMMLRGAQSKVTSALLKLAGSPSGPAELTVSPVELSTRVGLDVEAVKRTVQRLRDRHYIRITGERIEIPDVDALRRLHALLGTKDELGVEGRRA